MSIKSHKTFYSNTDRTRLDNHTDKHSVFNDNKKIVNIQKSKIAKLENFNKP